MRTLASAYAALLIAAVFGLVPPAQAAHPSGTASEEPLRLAQASPAATADKPAAKPAQPSAAGTATKAPAKPDSVAAGKSAPLIDINTATEQELATLHGIGEARAKAIVKGRPYARKDELVRRKIIPQSVYDGIREQIIAKQP